jgi:hypothetical protein
VSISAEPVITDRNQQFRVWENIQAMTNELGEVLFTTNRWTELGNGICYQDPVTGVWLDSEALVEAHPLGAIAQRAPHTVLFAQDIATPGSIDILLPDRLTHLRGHPLGLYFQDALDGNSQLIAPVASAVGEILPPNKVIYRGAFGVVADMVYVCERGFVTACVVMRQRPVLPPGFNAEFARLQVISEWLDPPAPQIREQIIWQETHPAGVAGADGRTRLDRPVSRFWFDADDLGQGVCRDGKFRHARAVALGPQDCQALDAVQ